MSNQQDDLKPLLNFGLPAKTNLESPVNERLLQADGTINVSVPSKVQIRE